MISEISDGAEQQAAGINELNAGVGQLDRATQQNAGLVQVSKQQGEDLVQAARQLGNLMENFEVGSDRLLASSNVVSEGDASKAA